MQRRLALFCALGLLVACSSPGSRRPSLTHELGPGDRVAVILRETESVTVKNLGPGRLGLRFAGRDQVSVWLSPGGAAVVRGRENRTVHLTAKAGLRTRFRVLGHVERIELSTQ